MVSRFYSPDNTGKSRPEEERLRFRPSLKNRSTTTQEGFRRGFLQEIKSRIKAARRQSAGRGGKRGRGLVKPESGRLSQKVIVKATIVRTRGKPVKALHEHLRYLQRDGAGLDGNEPRVFDHERELSLEESHEWGQELSNDRHHFRLIVSPERAGDLDLKRYTRELVKDMERDLGTSLDWIAVDHHNTDNPHVHILLRGVDERGKDLVLSRDYVSRGIRINAQEIATRELGLRTELELQVEKQRSLTQNRYTGFDRGLEREAAESPERLIDLHNSSGNDSHFTRTRHHQKVVRLMHLKSLELANEVAPGVWKISDDLAERLRVLSIKHDIIKSLHQRDFMKDKSNEPELLIFDQKNPPADTISGKVIHRGFIDEISDRQCLVVSCDNDKAYYLTIPKGAEIEGLPCRVDDIVRIKIEKEKQSQQLSIRQIGREQSRSMGRELSLGFQLFE